METLQILYIFLYQYDVRPYFAFNAAAFLLGMGLYLEQNLISFLSCFRDVAGGYLFLDLVSKTDPSGSVMFKSGDYGGQGKC
jgi:hypothetical protein